MERHSHLDYCLACEKLLHPLGDLFRCIRGRFYVCSQKCLDDWNLLSLQKQNETVQKEMSCGKIE
jgi:hypothetical protein